MSLKNRDSIKNRLYGHKDFLSQFCIAKQKGELHHAYLISGNIGIGKSFLSRQLAVYLLDDNNKKTLLDNSFYIKRGRVCPEFGSRKFCLETSILSLTPRYDLRFCY